MPYAAKLVAREKQLEEERQLLNDGVVVQDGLLWRDFLALVKNASPPHGLSGLSVGLACRELKIDNKDALVLSDAAISLGVLRVVGATRDNPIVVPA